MPDHSIQQGEAATLLTRYHAALYCYVFSCVRSHHDAEDILQNVALTVMESIGRLRSADGFLPWAREIARYCVLTHRRKTRRETPLDPELVQRLAEAAEELERDEPTPAHHEALLACLAHLPGESRRLLLQRYRRPAGEVSTLATKLGRSIQSIYARLKRIKAVLRECIRRRLSEESPP